MIDLTPKVFFYILIVLVLVSTSFAGEKKALRELSSELAATSSFLEKKPVGSAFVRAHLANLYHKGGKKKGALCLLKAAGDGLSEEKELFETARLKTALAASLYECGLPKNGKRALTSGLRTMNELTVLDMQTLYPEIPVERAETGRLVLLAKMTKASFDAAQPYGEYLGCDIVASLVRANRGEDGGRFLVLLRGIIKPAFGELSPHLIKTKKVTKLLTLMKSMDEKSRALSQAALVAAYVKAGKIKEAKKMAAAVERTKVFAHLRAEIWLASVDESREGLQRVTDAVNKIRSLPKSTEKEALLAEGGRAAGTTLHASAYEKLDGMQSFALGAAQRHLAAKTWSGVFDWAKLIKSPYLRFIYLVKAATATTKESVIIRLFEREKSVAQLVKITKGAVPKTLPFNKDEVQIVEGASPLLTFFRAAAKGDGPKVQKLLDEGAPPRAVDTKGATALHHSAKRGHVHVTTVLVNNGADINARTPKGKTPLHVAAQAGRGGALKILIRSGAKLDLLDKKGFTALHYAIGGKYEKMVLYLLKKGASAKKRGKGAPTALAYARTKGCSKRIINTLRNRVGGK